MRFRLRCRNCGKVIFSAVARLSVLEVQDLLAHLKTCRSDLSLAESDLGEILAHFDARQVD